jgi:hypothetical protein
MSGLAFGASSELRWLSNTPARGVPRAWLLAIFQPPAHGFCVQCAFLCEYILDPEEMLAVRKALDADRED